MSTISTLCLKKDADVACYNFDIHYDFDNFWQKCCRESKCAIVKNPYINGLESPRKYIIFALA